MSEFTYWVDDFDAHPTIDLVHVSDGGIPELTARLERLQFLYGRYASNLDFAKYAQRREVPEIRTSMKLVDTEENQHVHDIITELIRETNNVKRIKEYQRLRTVTLVTNPEMATLTRAQLVVAKTRYNADTHFYDDPHHIDVLIDMVYVMMESCLNEELYVVDFYDAYDRELSDFIGEHEHMLNASKGGIFSTLLGSYGPVYNRDVLDRYDEVIQECREWYTQFENRYIVFHQGSETIKRRRYERAEEYHQEYLEYVQSVVTEANHIRDAIERDVHTLPTSAEMPSPFNPCDLESLREWFDFLQAFREAVVLEYETVLQDIKSPLSMFMTTDEINGMVQESAGSSTAFTVRLCTQLQRYSDDVHANIPGAPSLTIECPTDVLDSSLAWIRQEMVGSFRQSMRAIMVRQASRMGPPGQKNVGKEIDKCNTLSKLSAFCETIYYTFTRTYDDVMKLLEEAETDIVRDRATIDEMESTIAELREENEANRRRAERFAENLRNTKQRLADVLDGKAVDIQDAMEAASENMKTIDDAIALKDEAIARLTQQLEDRQTTLTQEQAMTRILQSTLDERDQQIEQLQKELGKAEKDNEFAQERLRRQPPPGQQPRKAPPYEWNTPIQKPPRNPPGHRAKPPKPLLAL